ncbi:MAG TPA: addiction module protein [Terriglobales bacterium]
MNPSTQSGIARPRLSLPRLPVDERAALANTLLDSLETRNQSVETAWNEEVARRMEDLKAGKAVTVPWEQVHRELLAMVNER